MADDREREGEELARLRKRLERERHARQEAEQLAEQGTRQLYERQRELALFNTITDAANGAPTTREAIQITLNEICAYTGWPVGHAYLLGDDPDYLVSAKIWHLDHPEKFAAFREVSERYAALLRGISGGTAPKRVLHKPIGALISFLIERS